MDYCGHWLLLHKLNRFNGGGGNNKIRIKTEFSMNQIRMNLHFKLVAKENKFDDDDHHDDDDDC